MFLAEATNNDVITWGFILVVTTIGANLAVIIGTRRKQKREVSFEFTPASKEEFDRHVAANDQTTRDLFAKIGGVERGANGNAEKKIEALQHERREDVRQLHQEINEVGRKVAGLEKETELQNQSMASMNAKLDRLIERRS